MFRLYGPSRLILKLPTLDIYLINVLTPVQNDMYIQKVTAVLFVIE